MDKIHEKVLASSTASSKELKVDLYFLISAETCNIKMKKEGSALFPTE